MADGDAPTSETPSRTRPLASQRNFAAAANRDAPFLPAGTKGAYRAFPGAEAQERPEGFPGQDGEADAVEMGTRGSTAAARLGGGTHTP